MSKLFIDYRPLAHNASVSWDLAHHAFARQLPGDMVVVTTNPVSSLSAARKQWKHVLRQVEQERARTLNAARIMELGQLITSMEALRFVLNNVESAAAKTVRFATPEDLEITPPACHTMYVVCELSKEKLAVISAAMPEHGVVVMYPPNHAPAQDGLDGLDSSTAKQHEAEKIISPRAQP